MKIRGCRRLTRVGAASFYPIMSPNSFQNVAAAGCMGFCAVAFIFFGIFLIFPGAVLTGMGYNRDEAFSSSFFDSSYDGYKVAGPVLLTLGFGLIFVGILFCVIVKKKMSNLQMTGHTTYAGHPGGYCPTSGPVQYPPQPYTQQHPQTGVPYPPEPQFRPTPASQYPEMYPQHSAYQYPDTAYPPNFPDDFSNDNPRYRSVEPSAPPSYDEAVRSGKSS